MRRKVFFGCSCFYTQTTPISNYDKKWPHRYEIGVENWVLDSVIIMQKVDIFVVLARNMPDGAEKKRIMAEKEKLHLGQVVLVGAERMVGIIDGLTQTFAGVRLDGGGYVFCGYGELVAGGAE